MKNPLQVREDLLGLDIEVAHADDLSVAVDRCLPRNEQEVADAITLGEAERLVGIWINRDLLYLHRLFSEITLSTKTMFDLTARAAMSPIPVVIRGIPSVRLLAG